MIKKFLIFVFICFFAGCSTTNIDETINFNEMNVNLITAKNVKKGEGVYDITDSFNFEGRIYIYATFTWPEISKKGGEKTITVKWYNGENLISKKDRLCKMSTPPYYVWFSTKGPALGEGDCKAEIYINERLAGTKLFKVNAK